MQTPFRFLVTVGVFIALTPIVYAQNGGNTDGSGSGLGGLTGGTASSSAAGGSSATGQSSANGSGLTGESSFGGAVPGQSTAVSNAAQSFIGANATQGFIGGATQVTNQPGNNRQFQAIQNNMSQQNAPQQTGTPREIRTTLRVGFAYPTASQSQMTGRLANANLASLSRFVSSRPELADVSVALQADGVAVLTGSVPSAETSRLAANLIRLQPGIRKVENQIALPVN
jgi:hypothetical protein